MLSPFLEPLLPSQQTFTLTESQLPSLAMALVQVAQPKTIISIEGGLGAGKTTLIRSMGQALGIQTRMTSPTYVYFNQYNLPTNPTGITQVLHVDFYRLSENDLPTDSSNWLVEELLELQAQAPTLILAEWASVVAEAFQPLILHHLQIKESTTELIRQYGWFSHQRLVL
jgi:tRNA threonylcarbamoyl adenosine modification protein YjeE